MNGRDAKRFLEILPGTLSWGIIIGLALLAGVRPVLCAVVIITFDFYWIIRTGYLTALLIMAHRKLYQQRDVNWLSRCEGLFPQKRWADFYHVVIFPVYKEGADILRASLEALRQCNYPKEKMFVIVAFEERYGLAKENAVVLAKEFGNVFGVYLSTFHPDGLAGEGRTKGANASWAAKKAKEYFDKRGIAYDKVIASCFDADTCVEKEYFGCLTYHFLTAEKPHQTSYQPIPVYNNNIWYVPSFARLVEIMPPFAR